ncbi:DNL zinc finger-domain-containing protein [Mycena floridula]|nr:DNL zinc finger-domain-containing protein [Mycena floridula]
MLPSRLHRNLGIPPLLRSLVRLHPSLPATLSVLLRFRLGLIYPANDRSQFSTSTQRQSKSVAASSPAAASPGPEEPKMQITFTCTADDCDRTRSTHQFTKRAYETGIVLIRCPGCKNRHLIADNLGWFEDSTNGGAMKNIEDILRAQGETVKRGVLQPTLQDPDKVVEFVPEK